MEVTRDRVNRTATLRQRGAQHNLFNEVIPTWETDDIESFAKVPKQPNGPLSAKNTELKLMLLDTKETKKFQKVVGELNWTTNTAPDFIFSVRCSARVMKKPTE